MEIYEIQVSSGIYAISLVPDPAIQEHFITLSESEDMKFSAVEEKQHLFGPILIPDYVMPRRGGYAIKISAENILKSVELFGKEVHDITLHHKEKTTGCYMFESFISDENKVPTQYKHLPLGTWYGTFKVEDPELWKRIKEDEFSGFSIEGIFQLEKPDEKTDVINKLKQFITYD